jgi:hypothetical protein
MAGSVEDFTARYADPRPLRGTGAAKNLLMTLDVELAGGT